MDVIREFDPWKDPLCTCPRKYGLNPYTGCLHSCVYCYISSYIPRAFECRPKKDLLYRVERDLRKADPDLVISMSNSSDPYPPVEAELRLTRGCLELMARERRKVQIITKSDLVVRDLDLLKKIPCVVSFTITTLDETLASKLEPGAPSPSARLRAMRRVSHEIPVALRLDPLIPLLNDHEVESIVGAAAKHGASHVTGSTFKPRLDGWRRFSSIFRDEASKLNELYFTRGKRKRGWYLPMEMREKLMLLVREACQRNNLTFATCREGLSHLNTGMSCDGTHLIGAI
ncbi:MAG: radical SAM protein [Candidatus Hadarchaeales archaeon]